MLPRILCRLPAETQSSWKSICSGRLQETNSANELKPAVEEKRTLSSDDEDTDFRDIQFPQDSALQQVGDSENIAWTHLVSPTTTPHKERGRTMTIPDSPQPQRRSLRKILRLPKLSSRDKLAASLSNNV